jgi:hypothetical protein
LKEFLPYETERKYERINTEFTNDLKKGISSKTNKSNKNLFEKKLSIKQNDILIDHINKLEDKRASKEFTIENYNDMSTLSKGGLGSITKNGKMIIF